MNYHIIIPVRYHSQRLPGKALLDIHGKSMLQRVYEKAKESDAKEIIIATDHDEIALAAKGFGARVCMTRVDHASGSERITEVLNTLALSNKEIIVNLQGDEPLIPLENIKQVVTLCKQHRDAAAATLYEKIDSVEELFDPNIVKVVFDERGYALYFSRAPISWERDHFVNNTAEILGHSHYRHIGLYAYRAGALRNYVQGEPSPLELAEKLEQLRFLWRGQKIVIAKAPQSTLPGVDTAADLERVRRYIQSHSRQA
ncbi:MAG: 3-deoxy-manno-octulosonate cytidylyltransferase [Gammaproteobacteria bacterium]|jgi:3-deoxy-manno-octulosonate cytidylyltransferase (CMP-KDO synthetase)|nr:3-deoxy-manno-octulosonate cytidylyltransferase [Gammaproteobacteria bacterium]